MCGLIAQEKTLKDFFLPMEPQSALVKFGDTWGDASLMPRDTANGLEDASMKYWCYWDGSIVKDDEGKYHMYASRWDQKNHHSDGWRKNSKAMHAVANKAMGPYKDLGMTWSYWWEGRAHNTIGLKMHDGRYAMVTSEITNGEVFVSDSPYGPFEFYGELTTDLNGYRRGLTRYNKPPHRMANVMIIRRPDNRYMIMARWCAPLISDHGILGPYKVMGEAVWRDLPGVPQKYMEDPTIWYSDGLYHVVVNHYMQSDETYHLTSEDGIHNWKNRGIAFEHDSRIFRYTNGDVDEWFTVQRPTVYVEDNKISHFNFSVIDVHKGKDGGNDNHGSKVIVVPFDSDGFEKYIKGVVAEEHAAADATPAPSGWTSVDIGNSKIIGNTGYSKEFNTLRIKASGNAFNNKSDAFRYVYKKMSGDVMASTLVMSQDITSEVIKAGLMFRQSLKPKSKFLSACIEKNKGFSLERRTGKTAKEIVSKKLVAPYWLRMVKKENRVTTYISQTNKFNWEKIDETIIDLDEAFYVGVAASSLNMENLNLARFKDVDVHELGQPKTDHIYAHNLPDSIPQSQKVKVRIEYECAEERKLSLGMQNTTTWNGYNSVNKLVKGYGFIEFDYEPDRALTTNDAYRFNLSLIPKDKDWKSAIQSTLKEAELERPYISVKNIKLSDTVVTLNVGEIYQLSAEIHPEKAWSKKLFWSTENNKIAEVDQVLGKVYALKKGKTTIQVKNSEGIQSKCKIIIQ
ncbi:Ig-like domain-containing protein [Flavivirga algicola]|uniref:BIG2 domain-containing protein n=1 Tax=Flavivirga algicola TaxID=2729136 RepID=A0ABX1RWV6_9FLAO|nr:Ig-like domain-containing protein [Flavivirga algicola]NMH86815.1 hypothetical protein [Flavivirga algicola]